MADTLFYSPDIQNNPILPELESRHCTKVLRMRAGDLLSVTNGKGQFFSCKLLHPDPKKSVVSILHQWEKPKNRNYQLHIAFGPTKQIDRNEWFVEKATEIGIDRITPIVSRYSERKEIKKERLEKIAISAMKQSRQAYLPIIDKILPFELFINHQFEGRKFIAHCHNQPKELLSQTCKEGEDTLLLIGPEGDFSEQEVCEAIEQGFQPISLGEQRLRTETACLVAVHTLHLMYNQ